MPAPISLPPNLGDYLEDSTVYIFWNTFNYAMEPATLTGLAVTDIEIYKNASMTQRSSVAGYTLIDTDGIDIDGVTGSHGVSIDLSDDTDSGFYARGNDYMVMVNAITVDGISISFCSAIFSVENRAGRDGVGDYEVTLTIRKTSGTPVWGISDWFMSSNSRSGSVAGSKVTDTNGQVVCNLEYMAYYIFCHLSHYTFDSASFTSAAVSV